MALTNNDILKKLRVAHKLRDTDIIEICALVDFRISKAELGAFFQKRRSSEIHGMWGSNSSYFP